jgi:hypothetical protein
VRLIIGGRKVDKHESASQIANSRCLLGSGPPANRQTIEGCCWFRLHARRMICHVFEKRTSLAPIINKGVQR